MKKKKYITPKLRKPIKEQYSDGLRQSVLSGNISSEAVAGDSFLTVIGHSELWIENYKALLTYENNNIVIQAKNHMISIEGTGLIISHYMEEHMMIRGNIFKITYL